MNKQGELIHELASVISIQRSLHFYRDFDLRARLRLKEKQLRADLLGSEDWSLPPVEPGSAQAGGDIEPAPAPPKPAG